MRQMENGALRILCSSTTNALFSGNSGAVLNIVITSTGNATDDYTVSLKNVVLTDPQATRYPADDAQAQLSQDVIDGIYEFYEIYESIESYYDLNGRKIDKPQKGVNIIQYSDGTMRKVMIK